MSGSYSKHIFTYSDCLGQFCHIVNKFDAFQWQSKKGILMLLLEKAISQLYDFQFSYLVWICTGWKAIKCYLLKSRLQEMNNNLF